MNSTDLVIRFIAQLEAEEVDYMLVGSYSSNRYGRPRSTNDADFVAVISAQQLSAIAKGLGPEFRVQHQMSFETITMTTRYVIDHPASAFKIELFLLSDDPHDRKRFQRRTIIDFEGNPAWLPTPEDVVVTKLRWSKGGKRAKDIDDVAKILAVRGNQLDHEYICEWCDQHGTRPLFDQLLEDSKRFWKEQS